MVRPCEQRAQLGQHQGSGHAPLGMGRMAEGKQWTHRMGSAGRGRLAGGASAAGPWLLGGGLAAGSASADADLRSLRLSIGHGATGNLLELLGQSAPPLHGIDHSCG